jgi:hypothetical protein
MVLDSAGAPSDPCSPAQLSCQWCHLGGLADYPYDLGGSLDDLDSLLVPLMVSLEPHFDR